MEPETQLSRAQINLNVLSTLFELRKVKGYREVQVTVDDLNTLNWQLPYPNKIYSKYGVYRVKHLGGLDYKILNVGDGVDKKPPEVSDFANDPLPIDTDTKKIDVRKLIKSGARTAEEIDTQVKKQTSK